MSRTSLRTRANLGWLVVFTAGILVAALLRFGGPILFRDAYTLTVDIPEGGGILPGMPVTVLGTSVGTIDGTEITREGVRVRMSFPTDSEVPSDVLVQVLRRSPIGEQAIELTPVPADWDPPENITPSTVSVSDSWEPAEPGARLRPIAVVTPSSVPGMLEKAERLLTAIPVDRLSVVVDELATAVEGRVPLLKELGRDTQDLSETFVDGIPEAERLIANSEDILDALVEHRDALEASITDTADVVETLAALRPDMEQLVADAGPALEAADELVRDLRPNLSCLNDDFLALGQMTAEPENLANLAEILDLNRFFYGGFDAGTQWDPYRPEIVWARVNILFTEEAGGQLYAQPRPTPPTLPGAACQSPFGVGVNAVRQDNPQPPDPTSPGIRYAPLVEGADSGGPDGDTRPGPGTAAPAPAPPSDRSPLPATGGGALPAGFALLAGGSLFVMMRRGL